MADRFQVIMRRAADIIWAVWASEMGVRVPGWSGPSPASTALIPYSGRDPTGSSKADGTSGTIGR